MARKFAASYSGGKDSVLAIYKAIQQGNQLIALITTYNKDKDRSWFHGLPKPLLESVSESLDVPSWLIETTGKEYAENFEKSLLRVKEHGVDACVFGDIDIEEHREWCNERCQAVGIEAVFPLWNKNRKELVYEFIDNGFTANITVIDTNRLGEHFLGQKITKTMVDQIEAYGADICGENGEYHTFVSEGPIFSKPIDFLFKEKIIEDNYAILPISVAKNPIHGVLE